MTAMKKWQAEHWLWAGVVLLALPVVGLFIYKFSPEKPELPMTVAGLSACDLQQGPCTSTIPGLGSVTLAIAPRPIPLVEKLQLEVQTAAAGLRSVEVDFRGVDMNMGFNRFRLKPAGDDGLYKGEGMLPVCVRNRMTWEASVLLVGSENIHSVPFRFETFSGQ